MICWWNYGFCASFVAITYAKFDSTHFLQVNKFKKVNDHAFNNSFHTKIESIKYNACLAITEAIWGMSKKNLHEELGL